MKKRWQVKERRDAKDLGGNVTPRSGGFWSFAGDVKTDRFLLDSKYTETDHFKVSTKIWNKIYDEALLAQKTPILSLEIENLELVVIDKYDFLTILGKLDKIE